jgi:hypothetical protein
MVQMFPHELEGMVSGDRMRDAADLIAACSVDALALLNQEILSLSGTNIEDYNFIYSPDPFRVKARLQALSVLPMLKWEFTNVSTVTDRVRRRIDDGQSVWDAYLEFHSGKASILRRLASSPSCPTPWRGNLEALLVALDPFPPERVPSNDEEWNAFHSIWLGLGLDVHRFRSRDSRFDVVKLRWLEELGRMGWVKAYRKFAALEGGFGVILDAFDFLIAVGCAGDYSAAAEGQVGGAVEGERQRSEERWMRLPTAFGLFRIIEWSARWHRRLLDDAGLEDRKDLYTSCWPLLLPKPVSLGEGVQAVSLGTASDLAEEGNRMRHCVGSYLPRCFIGECHIVSLRNASGRSLSTIEITLETDGQRNCRIVQHRTDFNRTPNETLRSLEGNLIGFIRRNADFKALAIWRKKTTAAYGPLVHWGRAAFGPKSLAQVADVMGESRLRQLFEPATRRGVDSALVC